jgi:cytochrome oxidase Cu insertion factor (SCO1/SenC/PrrC family)
MSKQTRTLLGVALVIGLIAGFGASLALNATAKPGAAQIKNAKLKVGDAAPDFRLPDHTGGYVRLSNFRGKQNVVIAFYPAAFTPV